MTVAAIVASVVGLLILWRAPGSDSKPASHGSTTSRKAIHTKRDAGADNTATERDHDVGNTGRRRDHSSPRPALPSTNHTTGSRSSNKPKPSSNRSATMTHAGLQIRHVVSKLVDECYALAKRRNPALRGVLEMSVQLLTDPSVGNLIAKAQLDKNKTTVADKELLRCATENVFAAEELLDKLKAQGDATRGNIVLLIKKQFPPPKDKQNPTWPSDDSSPRCPSGTKLAGHHGKLQWCARTSGTKHGEQYMWGAGKLRMIMMFNDGTSKAMRMRPPGV